MEGLWDFPGLISLLLPCSRHEPLAKRLAMPKAVRKNELLDCLWERVEPLLPPKPAHPKGGHPFCDDKECFAGIVYQLRNGIRWNDMPKCFPSSATCWRRHRDWCLAGVWESIWLIVLEE